MVTTRQLFPDFDPDDPTYPEAVVVLVDALRNYLRAEDDLRQDLLSEGLIAPERFVSSQQDTLIKTCMWLLRRLEKWEVDPSLNGVRRGQ